MSNRDSLGDRMKRQYEDRTRILLPRRTYTIIRLDGKAFHTYTRGLSRPYDSTFMDDMDYAAEFVCCEIQGCQFGYVQSDEVSLLLTDFENISTDAWFDGNIQKIVSVAASMMTAKFNQLRACWHLPHMPSKLAMFDARVFTIPDPVEVENYFIWRQQDATRNSIQSAAQSMFSPKELHGLSCAKLQEKMWQEKGVNWNDYPEGFKRGRMVFPVERTQAPPVFTQEREYLSNLIPRI